MSWFVDLIEEILWILKGVYIDVEIDDDFGNSVFFGMSNLDCGVV